MTSKDTTAEDMLARLWDPKNYPAGSLAPYEEFSVGENVYYFTPGRFLHRKEPGSEEVGGYFGGYLTDEAWHYRTDDG